MSELSGRCEHEFCYLENSNVTSIRLYQCSHHCKKMLCIEHLFEHDQYIEKRTQDRIKLEHLFNDYVEIFDEYEIRKELKRLRMKLANHEKLCEDVGNLLFVNVLHDSMDRKKELQTVIERLEQAIEQEKQSKQMTGATSHGTQNNNVNVSTTENGVGSEVINNNVNDPPAITVDDQIDERKVNDQTNVLIVAPSSDNIDEKDGSVSSENNCDADDEVDSADDNEHRDEILPSSENLCTHITNKNQLEQINHVNEQSATMNTTSPSSELPESQNMSAANQQAFRKAESTSSLEDMHGSKQSSPLHLDGSSSEKSCY